VEPAEPTWERRGHFSLPEFEFQLYLLFCPQKSYITGAVFLLTMTASTQGEAAPRAWGLQVSRVQGQGGWKVAFTHAVTGQGESTAHREEPAVTGESSISSI
jgi:hypothetical protein